MHLTKTKDAVNAGSETAEEIIEAALELVLTAALGYNVDFTPEQAAREHELGLRCRAWVEEGYILSGKRRPV